MFEACGRIPDGNHQGHHDGQRDLVQTDFSDSQRQFQTVVDRLESLENRATNLSPQAPTAYLPVELTGAFLVLFCFCWDRYVLLFQPKAHR